MLRMHKAEILQNRKQRREIREALGNLTDPLFLYHVEKDVD